MTSRNYLFTINVRDETLIEEELLHLQAKLEDGVTEEKIRYAVFQHERGENGTNHFQGYVVLKNPVRLSGIKNLISQRGHYETRAGTHDQAKTYCTKEDTRVAGPWSYGDEAGCGQGKRNDLLACKKRIDEGATDLQLWEEHFGTCLKYHKGFAVYKRLKLSGRDWAMDVHVYVGAPGTGKSRRCRDENPGAYWKQRSQWWDGYEGHDCVVLDDFYGWLPFDLLLRVLDRYPLMVESKGGQIQFLAKKVVLTSNKGPLEWYKELVEKNRVDIRALIRRVTTWACYRVGGKTYEGGDYEAFSAALAMGDA